MGLTDRTIEVAKDVPRILGELMAGGLVELVPDSVSLQWPGELRHVVVMSDRIRFNPPATIVAQWLGVTINTELHHLEIMDGGRTVVVSITGPDITLTLEPKE